MVPVTPSFLSLVCEVSNYMKHFIGQVALSICRVALSHFPLFSDGDRTSQPEGGGGGFRERGGAADVLHPARPAGRRRRPHPCGVSVLSHFHSSSCRSQP